MPIYAYKCSSCGHGADVMQKLADAPLSVCPACGESAFTKQITAAGFQLKGSGWYATDFKNGSKGAKKEATETAAEKPAPTTAAEKSAPTTAAEKSAPTTAAEKSAPPADAKPAPSGGSGGRAAC